MLMIEPATASAATRLSAGNFDRTSRRLPHFASFFIPRFRRSRDGSGDRSCGRGKSGVRASVSKEQSGRGPVKPQRYHPFEDIAESELPENGEAATLTPAETTRTIIEVNSKATLMFSGLLSDEVHENIFWPDLPYVTDEHGNIYFQVKNAEDILQTLTAEESLVQVIIGLDTAEMLSEIELAQSEIDFGIDELDDEDSDFDDDDDDIEDDENEDNSENWVAVLDEEEDQADDDSDGSLGDWAKLETMRSSHPMYFAKKLAEVVSDDPVDFMDQPPAGLAVQGLLRPAFVEEHVIQKHISDHQSDDADTNQIMKVEEHDNEDTVQINGHRNASRSAQDSPTLREELDKDETITNGTSFYKLEMVKIQLISSHGHQTFVEMEDFRRARPDAIAHSAAKIISRVKSGGEKTARALRSLCWRLKKIQVEEVALIGVDSLGFDLRICSGAQVETLRFAFKKRASSEYAAERQLNDLLFPRCSNKPQQKKEAHQTET